MSKGKVIFMISSKNLFLVVFIVVFCTSNIVTAQVNKVDELIRRLDPMQFHVEEAVEALVKIGEPAVIPLISVLEDENSRNRAYAAEILGKIKDARAIEPLIKQLNNQMNGVDEVAVEALVNIGKPAVTPLIAALKDKNKRIRAYVAETLGKIKDVRAVEPLLKTLGDENDDDWVRGKTAVALGKIKDVRAVEPLITMLNNDAGPDSDFIGGVTWALGQIGDVRAIEPLIAYMGRGSFLGCAPALMQIGKPAVEPLIAALKDEPYRAAWALGEIGDVRAIEPLIATLNGKYEKPVGVALVKFGKPAVEPLIVALKDKNTTVRLVAAWALGEIKDGRAVEPLIAKLKDKDIDVRATAAGALGQIGDVRAVESLIATLKDTNVGVRMRAAKALGQIGDAGAIEPLNALISQTSNYEGIEIYKIIFNKFPEGAIKIPEKWRKK